MTKFILAALLALPLQSFADDIDICIESDEVLECFDNPSDAKQFADELYRWHSPFEAVRGRTGTDNPNITELMNSAIDAIGSRSFQGEIIVEVSTPSGFIFKVTVRASSRRTPKMISKPEK
tara:strand:- start:1326 stop:1688 length:363 start_codon:yes stop_codon:yes gene_type:complete